jgi:hypothetical protein
MGISQSKYIMLGINNIFINVGIIFGLLVAMYLVLWLCILLLRRITGYGSATPNVTMLDGVAPDKDLRARIAAAAVAMAIALENETDPHEFPLPPTALISAWQAVKRADILKRHGGRPR